MAKRERVGLVLLFLVGLVVLLALTAKPVNSEGLDAAPYATFEHNGVHYYVSAAQQEGTWEDAVAFCESLEWNGGGWRLPTLEEAISMRSGWDGNDPFDVNQPTVCQGYDHPGIPELWTLTECDECGQCSGGRGAYTIHPSDVTILTDAHTKNVCSHEDDPVLGKYCCLVKEGYGPIHACPVARCVQPQEEVPPEDTPFPSPIATPDLSPIVEDLDYSKPAYPNVDTTLSATVYPSSEPLTYTWSFGDGLLETRVEVVEITVLTTHAYTATGAYTATLAVSNSMGTGMESTVVVVEECLMDFAAPWGYRDFKDILQWLKYMKAGDMRADLNGDGVLDDADGRTAVSLYHKPCPGLGE